MHSYFSLRYGTVGPKELIQLAEEHGHRAIALTDINNTSGILEFLRIAGDSSIKPVVGIDFRSGVKQQFIAIAKNNQGLEEINYHLTHLLHEKTTPQPQAPDFKNAFVIYPFPRTKELPLLPANAFWGVKPKDLDFIRLHNISTDKMVILYPATFRNKRDFNTHRLLRAINNNTLLSKLPISEQADLNHLFIEREILIDLYSDFPEIIANTEMILNESSVFFDFSENAKPQNQQTYTQTKKEDIALLKRLCDEGSKYRYPEANEKIKNRIQTELETIEMMGFVSYFLINWDIVKYARSKDYFYVGRGSGANSIVAYLLRITDVDPIELDLYFERFINLFRKNPPDFDIDFSWKDRDDITRYIFKKFKHVALLATYNTFKDKAVIRELGKVFGLPKEEIDKLTKGVMREWEMSDLARLVMRYAKYIHKLPSHLSIHASGIIISEKPLQYFSATFIPPKGFPTVQFDMHIAEDVGLYKFDILSQRGLSKIKDALDVIQYNRPEDGPIDIHNIREFKKDPRIKRMLKQADAIGCFYVESPAMRMLLRKLQVDDYLGLVAASSVIRPGVAQSGMMFEYIERYRHPEKRKNAHPELLRLMPETFGVMVYQEDVIKVAHHFAGLSLGEADKMRRGMSGKYRSRDEFQEVKEKFFKSAVEEKKRDPEITAEVWRQTESFAGYAFAKGHSASYAVESYQCLFLKAYYPLEFMVATINNYGGFYSTELYVLEAKLFGANIHAPCVNQSGLYTNIVKNNIYLGFHLLKSFDYNMAVLIEMEREKKGPYKDLYDFLKRIPIGIETLDILIRIDAFRFTGKDKRTLLWEAHLYKNGTKSGASQHTDLFTVEQKQYQIPPLTHVFTEDTFDQIELLGFPLQSAFSIIVPDKHPTVLAKDLEKYNGQKVWIKGYLIHRKRTTTTGGNIMFFGTFLDEEGAWLDTVHFPKIATLYPFRGKGVYRVHGTVLCEYDCITIETDYMEKMEVIEDPRYAEQRIEKEGLITSNSRKDYWVNTPEFLKK